MMYDSLSDERLMDLVKRGDPVAFNVLYLRHFARLVESLSGRHRWMFAEEVAQEALLRVLEKAGTWQGGNEFKAWLAQIARRCVVDLLRRGSPPPQVDVGAALRVYFGKPDHQRKILRARFWPPDDPELLEAPPLLAEGESLLCRPGSREEFAPSTELASFLKRRILDPHTKLKSVADTLALPLLQVKLVCRRYRKEVLSYPAVASLEAGMVERRGRDTSPDPEDYLRLARVLVEAYHDLKPRDRRVIYLRFFEAAPTPSSGGDEEPEPAGAQVVFRGGEPPAELSSPLAGYIVSLYWSKDKPNTYAEIAQKTRGELSAVYRKVMKYKKAVSERVARLAR